MIPWVTTALAVPVPNDLELADHAAQERIADCRRRGPACGADAQALGEAFATAALAGAVLRGTLDGQAVANAQALAPDTVAAWHDLLPAPEGAAETWVLAFVPPPPSAPVSPPPPRVHRTAPLRLGPGATEIRVSGGLARADGWGSTRGGLDAQWSLGPVGVISSADFTHTEAPQSAQFGDPYQVATAEASLGLGPRWSGRARAEVLPFIGGAVLRGEASRDGEGLDGGVLSLSPFAGVAFVAPVARRGAVALRGMARIEYEKMWSLDQRERNYAMASAVRIVPEVSVAPIEALTLSVGPDIHQWLGGGGGVTWTASAGWRR